MWNKLTTVCVCGGGGGCMRVRYTCASLIHKLILATLAPCHCVLVISMRIQGYCPFPNVCNLQYWFNQITLLDYHGEWEWLTPTGIGSQMCIYICHNHTGFSSKTFVGGRIAKATAQYHACHLCSSEREDQHLCILLCLPNSVHTFLQMYTCVVQLEAICQVQSEQYSMVYQSLCRVLQLWKQWSYTCCAYGMATASHMAATYY